ncbi:hypothetical protein AAG570_008460 [Ranatra chinensis]|uniref:Uncharacterized protein n=1 Tax=Ranatra chinensis TaxID=642074 RepID=A0ABD0YRK5_9HEMI
MYFINSDQLFELLFAFIALEQCRRSSRTAISQCRLSPAAGTILDEEWHVKSDAEKKKTSEGFTGAGRQRAMPIKGLRFEGKVDGQEKEDEKPSRTTSAVGVLADRCGLGGDGKIPSEDVGASAFQHPVATTRASRPPTHYSHSSLATDDRLNYARCTGVSAILDSEVGVKSGFETYQGSHREFSTGKIGL